MSPLLKDRIAVITGGATGIGLATAKKFVAEGAYVFIMGRRKPELDAAVAAIGENATAVQGNVTKLADLERLYATVKANQGKLDILVVNAAIAEGASLGAWHLLRDQGADPQFGQDAGSRSQGAWHSCERDQSWHNRCAWP